MLGVYGPKHLLLAEELVIVLFSLWIEPRIVIGIERLRSRCGRGEGLVEPAQAPRARRPCPGVVTARRAGVPITQQAGAASVLRRELRAEQEQPQPVGSLEIRIDRQRLYFGAADEIITGVVAQLSVGDFEEGLVVPGINRIA